MDIINYPCPYLTWIMLVNTLRPRQDGRYFADDVLKCIFLNENVWISLKIPLKFVPRGPINNIPALVQIMAWRRSGDKPLSEPMVVSLPTHICVARPQWVKGAPGSKLLPSPMFNLIYMPYWCCYGAVSQLWHSNHTYKHLTWLIFHQKSFKS